MQGGLGNQDGDGFTLSAWALATGVYRLWLETGEAPPPG